MRPTFIDLQDMLPKIATFMELEVYNVKATKAQGRSFEGQKLFKNSYKSSPFCLPRSHARKKSYQRP